MRPYRYPSRQRSSFVPVIVGLLALCLIVGLVVVWQLVAPKAPSATPTPTSTQTSQSAPSTPLPSPSVEAESISIRLLCDRATTYRMYKVGSRRPFISTSIVPIGLNAQNGLGDPSHRDRKKIGLYSLGPQPGGERGNILSDGHNYRDGSAVFKPKFPEMVKVGMIIKIGCRNGAIFTYKIAKIWRSIDKKNEYPAVSKKEKFYDFSGPEQLFGVTCSGGWDPVGRTHEKVTAFMAVPIFPPL